MSRLIDADKLIKKFEDAQKRAIETWGKEEIGMIPLDDLIDIINHTPTADIIGDIRCRDCCFCDNGYDCGLGEMYKSVLFCKKFEKETLDSLCCRFAERKLI